MIQPDKLADALEQAAALVRSHGDLTWQRTSDWTTTGRVPSSEIRGGGLGEASPDEAIEDRKADSVAGRYYDEMNALTARIDQDLHRLGRIVGICCPPRPRSLATRDMLVAQVAADGWCVSCWRDEQHLTPIALRTSGPSAGQPYYKDRCRSCGEHRAENGEDPPMEILRARHEGRRVRVKAS